jgi:hypothetical protein
MVTVYTDEADIFFRSIPFERNLIFINLNDYNRYRLADKCSVLLKLARLVYNYEVISQVNDRSIIIPE